MDNNKPCKELIEFWQNQIDWDVVTNRLNKLPAVKKYITIEELKNPTHGNNGFFYGIHPLARELSCKSLNENTDRLNENIPLVECISGGKERLRELNSLSEPSRRYWSWLSEIEVAVHLKQNLDSEITFSSESSSGEGGPDIEIKDGPATVYCEVTSTMGQELAYFELLQALHAISSQTFISCKREMFTPTTKISPVMVWEEIKRIRDNSLLETESNFSVFVNSEKNKAIIENHPLNKQSGPLCYYSPIDINEGNPQSTIENRLKNALCGKQKQLTSKHPNILCICMALDYALFRACEDEECNIKDIVEKNLGQVDVAVLFDNGSSSGYHAKAAWCKDSSTTALQDRVVDALKLNT